MNRIFFALTAAIYCMCSFESAAQETADTTVHELNEVVVSGKRVKAKGNHLELQLSRQNRSFGTNAVDAVSSLVTFRTQINSESLINLEGQPVLILINGRKSDGQELATYDGDNIDRVDYYPTAPPEFQAYTTGPVANVVMKRPMERLYAVNAQARSALRYLQLNGMLNTSYTDSLNRVMLRYNGNFSNADNFHYRKTFDYPASVTSAYITDAGHYNERTQSVNASYQRFTGKWLFNASASYSWDDTHRTLPGTIEFADAGQRSYGSSLNDMTLHKRQYSVDLYAHYNIRPDMVIVLDVLNTFMPSVNRSYLLQKYPEDYSHMDIDIPNYADNDAYSLIAHAYFEMPLLGGTFSVNNRYEYIRLKQHGIDDTYLIHKSNDHIGAYMDWRRGNKYLSIGAGADITGQTAGQSSRTKAAPWASLNTSWSPKNFYIRLRLAANENITTNTILSENRTYLDRYYYTSGNPAVHNYMKEEGSLSATYYSPKGTTAAGIRAGFETAAHPYFYVVKKAGDEFAFSPEQTGSYFIGYASVYASLRPFKWLELQPQIYYLHSDFDTPSGDTSCNDLMYGGQILITYRNLIIAGSAYSSQKTLMANELTWNSPSYNASVMYKTGNWAFTLSYGYTSKNLRTTVRGAGMTFNNIFNAPYSQNNIVLTATWRFTKGRARNFDSTRVQEGTSDNGLGRGL